MRLLLVLFLFISTLTYAQRTEKIDSLKTLLLHSEANLEKLNVLNHLYHESINYDIEASEHYATEIIALGQTLTLDSVICLGYERKGVTFAYRNMFDSSRVYFDKTLALAYKRNDYLSAGSALRNIGQDLNMVGDLDSALYFYTLSEETFRKANDADGVSGIYNSKAVVYWQLGYYNLALEEAFKADSILKGLEESPELYQNYMVIATAYASMKDTSNALVYYDFITDYFRKNGLQRQLFSNLILTATLQIPNSALKDQTEKQLQEAMDIAEQLQMPANKVKAQAVYAALLYHNGDYQQAKEILSKLTHREAMHGDETLKAEAHLTFGKTLMALGEYQQAVIYLKEANKAATQMSSMGELLDINLWLSKAYEKVNDPKAALAYYKTYAALNDSMYSSESQNRFRELQTIYETEKKEAQLELQQNEINALNIQAKNERLVKTLYAIGMFSFLAIATLLYFGFKQRMKKNRIEREKQEEIYKKELAFKKKELASQTLHLVQKSSFIQELKENLERIKSSPDLFKVEYRRLVMLLKKESAEDKDWEVFKSYFSEVHNDFDKKLKSIYADITEKEIRLASFIRMNLSTKEIASILNVLPDSVLKSKYRLKKKLELDKDQDLNAYLSAL